MTDEMTENRKKTRNQEFRKNIINAFAVEACRSHTPFLSSIQNLIRKWNVNIFCVFQGFNQLCMSSV